MGKIISESNLGGVWERVFQLLFFSEKKTYFIRRSSSSLMEIEYFEIESNGFLGDDFTTERNLEI